MVNEGQQTINEERITESLFRLHLKTPSCACLPVGRDGDERCVCRRQKKADQMLKQVQHDEMVRFRSCGHPELVSGSRSWVYRIWVLKPRLVGGALYSHKNSFGSMRNRIDPVEYGPKSQTGNWIDES